MRVLFLIPHPPNGASGRYRVLQYLPWLARQGITAEARPFMSETLYRMLYLPDHVPQKLLLATGAVMRRLVDLVRAVRADVVVVHREALPLGTAMVERVIARLSPALVFDFDDAIYLTHAHSANAWTRGLRNGAKTDTIIRLSTHVIAGNRVLEAYAHRFHQRVSLLPTPVDTDHYRPRPASGQRMRLVIGWIGSPTTSGYLAPLQQPLAQLFRRYPQLDIRIVGTTNPPLQLPNLRFIRWDLAREREELHQFDIGVMPMPDDEWARGKCGFKALLYMSAGIPVVASPIGINTEIVREGVNGFLASTPTEWVNRLGQLIEDPTLRERMGRSGRTIVEEEYSLRVSAPRLLRVLKDAGRR